VRLLFLLLGCAPSVAGVADSSFLGDLAFVTAQEQILLLAPDGLVSVRLDGRQRRVLVEAAGCRFLGGQPNRLLVRCGGGLYALERDRVSPLAGDERAPRLPRMTGCTSGADECVCTGGWRPQPALGGLSWRHPNGDARPLARAANVEEPFVSEDCQVVGFHSDDQTYLVHLPTGRIGRLGAGIPLRWPR
jgi:hypothetical protein